jgi:oligopeptidase B
VRRHEIGAPLTNDEIVFTDNDERFFVGIELTRSGRFIIIHSGSKTSSEIHLLDASTPLAEPQCVRPRTENVEYSVDDWGHTLVITTNLDAEDFCIMTAPHDDPSKWTDFVSHQPGHRITAAEPFEHTLAVHEWVNAQPRIRLVNTDGESRPIELTQSPHDIEFGPNENFSSDELRVRVQSLTQPSTIIDINIHDLSHHVIRHTPTPGVDLENYVSERHWATADDGTDVPYDVVRHKDYGGPLPQSSTPMAHTKFPFHRGFRWLGSHSSTVDSPGCLYTLEAAVNLVASGTSTESFLSKRNTFTDVIAATKDAVSRQLIDGEKLAIRGGSAGGLMVGACITIEPQLFASAVAEVPFVDVVSTMSDPSLPLTITEWEEWGDPRSEPYASYIESYSPYDNTRPANYPALLITAGLHDPRVSVHEPAKWTARLREVRTNDAPLLFKTEMGAGHGGPSGRYAAWEDEARTLTFLLETVTITT